MKRRGFWIRMGRNSDEKKLSDANFDLRYRQFLACNVGKISSATFLNYSFLASEAGLASPSAGLASPSGVAAGSAPASGAASTTSSLAGSWMVAISSSSPNSNVTLERSTLRSLA